MKLEKISNMLNYRTEIPRNWGKILEMKIILDEGYYNNVYRVNSKVLEKRN